MLKNSTFSIGLVFLTAHAGAAEVFVRNTTELEEAVRSAVPGETIVLEPGRYPVAKRIRFRAAGTSDKPITLKAAKLGQARIETSAVRAFAVIAPHWHFENLDIVGQCEPAKHSNCEHAFHITGNSDGTQVRFSRLVNFNAAIKGNGLPNEGGRVFPDDVVIEGTYIYNLEPRRTRNPVTPIDVVGGKRWKVIDNFMADYGRQDGIAAYHGFFKGYSSDGLMARNLVVCNWRHQGPGRVGLSLGGGGVNDHARDICEDGLCKVEHARGRVYGNVVSKCQGEPGIYLNAAEEALVSGNLLFDTTGIQLHTEYASATITGNVLNGGIRDRLGSTHVAEGNEFYGIKYGAFLPAGSAYLQRRLEGLDSKYPSLVKPWMVSWVQSVVAWVIDLVVGSPLGLGMWSMADIVVDDGGPGVTIETPYDFQKPNLEYDESETDFCGHSRAGDNTAGPFVSGLEPCDASTRIQDVLALEREYPLN